MKYTFGTCRAAAERLEHMAGFFNPRAELLVRAYAPAGVRTALDLGCGPGFTTDMLSRATGAARTMGLDNSEDFLSSARARFPHCGFIRHDVTRMPFPETADVVYVRFVLSHLPEPVDLVNNWITQVNPGGILVVEETEAVETEVPVFKTYLSTNEELMASTGAKLFVGCDLAGGDYPAAILRNECSVFPVPDRLAAAWFHPNTMTIWRTSDVVRARIPPEGIEDVSASLDKLKRSTSDESRITWKIRRIVFFRHKVINGKCI